MIFIFLLSAIIGQLITVALLWSKGVLIALLCASVGGALLFLIVVGIRELAKRTSRWGSTSSGGLEAAEPYVTSGSLAAERTARSVDSSEMQGGTPHRDAI